jgi:formylglycine-generating enzyme required for sulfatase activity
MELLSWPLLSGRIAEAGALGPDEAAGVAYGILGACQAAHAAGVVHSDLKPSAIFVEEGGRVVVTGFGLSKKFLHEGGVSIPGYEIETAEYLSPEQVSGEEVDARTDLYALGVILFEMLTGHPPYQSDSKTELRAMHTGARRPDPCEQNPSIPRPLGDFVFRLLAKRPEERFEGAEEALAGLEAALGGGAEPAPAGEPAAGEAEPEPEATEPAMEGGSILATLFSQETEAEEEEETGEEAPEPAPAAAEAGPGAGLPPITEKDFEEYGDLLDRGDVITQTQVPDRMPSVTDVKEAVATGAPPEPPKDDVDGNLRAARQSLDACDFNRAVFLANKVLAVNADDGRALEIKEKASAARAAYIEKSEEFERLLDRGGEVELEKLAREILALKPDDAGALKYLEGMEERQADTKRREEAQRLVLRAYRLLEKRDFHEAEGIIQRAAELDPDNPELGRLQEELVGKRDRIEELRRSAEEEYSRRDYARALSAYQELAELHPEDAMYEARLQEILNIQERVERQLQTAERLWDEKSIEKAEVALHEALDLSPENPRGLKLKREVDSLYETVAGYREEAEGYFANEQFDAAREVYDEIRALIPGDHDAEQKVAQIEVILKDRSGHKVRRISLAAAVVLFLGVVGLGALWYMQHGPIRDAKALMEKGKFSEALTRLGEADGFLVKQKTVAETERQIRQKMTEAGATVKTPGTKSPGTKQPGTGPAEPSTAPWSPHVKKARALLERREWGEALEAVEKAKKAGAPEENLEPLVRRAKAGRLIAEGLQLRMKGDWKGALAAYRKLEAVDKETAEERIDDLFQEELKKADKYRKEQRKYLTFLKILGEAFGRMKEIEPLLTKAAIDPRILEAEKYWEEGKIIEAIRLLKQTLETPQARPAAQRKLEEFQADLKKQADALFQKADYAGAVTALENLSTFFPKADISVEMKKARYNLYLQKGETKFAAGDFDGARRDFQFALKFATDDRAKKWIERIEISVLVKEAEGHEKARAWRKAREVYGKILEIRHDARTQEKVNLLTAQINFEEFVSLMNLMYQERKFADALKAARDAVATGRDTGGRVTRIVRYLSPLPHMALVPAGEFLKGDDKGRERERPAHRENLPAFFIGRNEVTVGEYAAFLRTPEGKAHVPLDWEKQKAKPGNPVVGVSLADARAYAQSLYCLIPTEAEWEKAARGTDGRAWPWGNEFPEKGVNTFESRLRRPAAVTAFPKDLSPFGCANMAGNVAEWTESAYGPYPGGKGQFPEGRVVVRGGDFGFGKAYARCASRRGTAPVVRKGFIGFRILRRTLVETLADLKD